MEHQNNFVQISLYELTPTLRLVLGAILTCLLFSLVPVALPFLIIRQIVIQSAKYFRPDLGSILTSQSCLFANDLFTEKPPRANVVATNIFSGDLDPEELRNNMVLKNWINATDKHSGELVYERFQQYPVRYLGYTFWKREDFDVDNHIFFHKNLGNETVSNEQLKRFEEELLNASYKPNTSTWEIHMVYNYYNPKVSSEPMTVAIFKMHHSLADGYSLLGALIEGLLQQPLAEHLVKPTFYKRNLWEQFKYLATAPFVLFGEFTTVFANYFRDSPWKVPDSEKSWNQISDSSDLIPVSKIKDVKNAFGVSFASVLVSAISAGMCDNFNVNRKIQVLKGEDSSVYTGFILPLPGHSRNLTNHATGVFIDIPTNEFSSCEKRLQSCHYTLECAKNKIFPLFLPHLMNLAATLFTKLNEFLVKSHAVSAGVTIFPTIPIKLRHGECEALAGRGTVGSLAGDTGVAFILLSQSEDITLTITAEEAVMSRKELTNFIKCFVQEIDLLHKMATQRNVRVDGD